MIPPIYEANARSDRYINGNGDFPAHAMKSSGGTNPRSDSDNKNIPKIPAGG